MSKDQHHSDHILYHHTMHVEFNNRKNFSLPLITSHSIMDAGIESKLRGAWSNLEAGGRLGGGRGSGGLVMFLSRTGEHVCPFVHMKGHLIMIFGQYLQGTLSSVFCAANDCRVR